MKGGQLGRIGALIGIAGIILGSCASASKPALWSGPDTVAVTMRDYRFEYKPVIPGGRVLFRVVNAGTHPHRLALVPLADDLPPIDAQLHGPVRESLAPFAGVRVMAPQTADSFAVDLVPGRRYAMVCFVKDPGSTESHALMGMNSEFRAGLPARRGP